MDKLSGPGRVGPITKASAGHAELSTAEYLHDVADPFGSEDRARFQPRAYEVEKAPLHQTGFKLGSSLYVADWS